MKKILSLFITILLFTTTIYAQNYWTTITNNAFGFPTSSTSPVLEKFKTNIFMSTRSVGDTTCIYASTSGNQGSFQKVFTGDQYKTINDITTTSFGGGYMYVGEGSYPIKVYRASDGTSQSNYNLYYQNSMGSLMKILPFKGIDTSDYIYVFINGSSNIIMKSVYNSNDPYNTNSSWTQVHSSSFGFTSAAVHNSTMYFANNNNMGLYKTSNGTTYTQVSYTPPPAPSGNNYTISAIAGFGSNMLIAGTYNYTNGAELWYNTNGGSGAWTLIKKYNGYDKVTSIEVHNGEVWATLQGANSKKALVERSTNGINFTTSLSSNFGDINNKGRDGNTSLFNGQIYYAFGSNTGAPNGDFLLRTCLSPPTINLGNDTTICFGLNATFSAPQGYSYMWNTGSTQQTITVNSTGKYNCIITDANGCSNIGYRQLKVDSLPQVYRTAPASSPYTSCAGVTVTSNYTINPNNRNMHPPFHKQFNMTIPTGATINDVINVNGFTENANQTIEWVRIDSLLFPNTSDLKITLYPPSGSPITLINQYNTSGSDFFGTMFNDNATSYITSGTMPYSGEFKPTPFLSSTSGPTNGPWKIEVQNFSSTESGFFKGWSIGFSKQDSVNYTWSPSNGVTPQTAGTLYNQTNNLNTNIAPTATTTYTLTTTNSTGCSKIDSLSLIVPTFNIINNDTALCASPSVTLYSSGNAATLWYVVGNPSPIGTGPSTIVTPPPVPGTTTYYAQANMNGCPLSDTVKITVNPPFSFTINAPQPICQGDSAMLIPSIQNGALPINYSWSPNNWINNNTIENPLVSPPSTQTYTLTATDAISCSDTYTVSVAVNPLTDMFIHAQALPPVGDVTSGSVVIYKNNAPAGSYQLDTIADTTTNNAVGGIYLFNNIPPGNYWLKVFPDTAASSGFSDLIPTYYPNQFQWDSTLVGNIGIITHGCTQTDSFIVDVIGLTGLPSGSFPGQLKGKITEGNGYNKSPTDPIPGVDVKVGRKPPGGNAIVTTGTTDSTGWYNFTNVPLNIPGEKYVLYVDIPGYGLDSAREVSLDATNPQQLQLNYYVDSTTIWIDSSLHSGSGIINYNPYITNISISPNPSNGKALIKYNIEKDAAVVISVYNILGVKLEELVNKKHSTGEHSLKWDYENNYTPGVYFIVVSSDSKDNIIRAIITR